jgi:hypothetical protein
MMTVQEKAGSNLPMEMAPLEAVSGPTGKPPAAKEGAQGVLGLGSFSTVFLWRGNGSVKLPLNHGWINPGSRVFASISEYNTAWNANRFIGLAPMQVLNVAPYNGGCYVWLNVNWGGPINVCISLLVDP